MNATVLIVIAAAVIGAGFLFVLFVMIIGGYVGNMYRNISCFAESGKQCSVPYTGSGIANILGLYNNIVNICEENEKNDKWKNEKVSMVGGPTEYPIISKKGICGLARIDWAAAQ